MPGRGRGLGRGRGRGKPIGEVPPLTPEQLNRFVNYDVVPDQFDDKEKDEAVPQNPSNSESENSKTKSPKNGSLEGNSLVREVKEAQRNLKVVPDESESVDERLNPMFNTEFRPKMSNGYLGIGSGRSHTSPSQLNPHSSEFVPQPGPRGSGLNVQAAEFVPSGSIHPISNLEPLYNDHAPFPEDTEDLEEQFGIDILTVDDILNGFPRETSGEVPALTAVASMLLEATTHPGTFDTHLSLLTNLMKRYPPSDELLIDIAELLITWGISNTGLRYTAVRICDYMCKLEIQDRFRKRFFKMLEDRFTAEQERTNHSKQEESDLIEFSMFMAEMFYRVRVRNDEVVWILGSAVLELIFILLNINSEDSIKCACNMLKLTGYLLEHQTPTIRAFDPHKKIETIITALRQMCVANDTSKRSSEVIINLLQYKATKWGNVSLPTNTTEKEEVPISKAEDWRDFVDETGNVIEGYDDDNDLPPLDIEDEVDPNIDEEIMRGYEEFLQEFEDHLLMQEFGQP